MNASVKRMIVVLATFGILPAQASVRPDSGVEMRVTLVDAGWRSLEGNRFLQGEEVLVKVQMLHCAALDYLERHRHSSRERDRPNKLESAQQPRPAPIALGSLGVPWTRGVTLTVQGGDMPARWTSSGDPVSTDLADATVELWSIDSALLPLGANSVNVRFDLSTPSGQKLPLAQEVSFEVIRPSDAAPSERSRVAMRRAQAALEAGRYPQATIDAIEFIRVGPADDYDLATSYRVLGAAHEAMKDARAAIEAYERAIEAVEERTPGTSRLPELLRVRIQGLRAAADSQR